MLKSSNWKSKCHFASYNFYSILVPINKGPAQCLWCSTHWFPYSPPLSFFVGWYLYKLHISFSSKTRYYTMSFLLNFPITCGYYHFMLMHETTEPLISTNLFLSSHILLALLRNIFYRIFKFVFKYLFQLVAPISI